MSVRRRWVTCFVCLCCVLLLLVCCDRGRGVDPSTKGVRTAQVLPLSSPEQRPLGPHMIVTHCPLRDGKFQRGGGLHGMGCSLCFFFVFSPSGTGMMNGALLGLTGGGWGGGVNQQWLGVIDGSWESSRRRLGGHRWHWGVSNRDWVVTDGRWNG